MSAFDVGPETDDDLLRKGEPEELKVASAGSKKQLSPSVEEEKKEIFDEDDSEEDESSGGYRPFQNVRDSLSFSSETDSEEETKSPH